MLPAGRVLVVVRARGDCLLQPGRRVFAADFRSVQEETGITVQSKYDTESTKTTGLAQTILAEGRRPCCDVFWNSEILNTLRLEKKGLLAAYEPAVAANYPAMDRSPQGLWHGFAARRGS